MKSILTYNRIVGNTFFGWTYHGEKIGKWTVWLYRLWNIVLVAILFAMSFGSYEVMSRINKQHAKSSLDNNATTSIVKVDLIKLLQSVSIVGINVQTLLISVYLLIFGGKLVDNLYKQEHLILDTKFERKITIMIIMVIIIYSVIGAMINTYSAISHFPSGNPFLFVIPMYLSTSTQVAILSFLAYKSLLLKHYLVKNSNHNLFSIYNVVFKIDESIKKLDRFVSVYILFTLLSNEIFCVSSICQLAIDFKSTIIDSCVFMFHGLTSLTVLCFCCNLIPSSLAKLLDQHEPKINVHADRLVIIQLRQLSNRIGFTAFGLFRVNANTFLSSLGLIITYSVIIIQTGGQ